MTTFAAKKEDVRQAAKKELHRILHWREKLKAVEIERLSRPKLFGLIRGKTAEEAEEHLKTLDLVHRPWEFAAGRDLALCANIIRAVDCCAGDTIQISVADAADIGLLDGNHEG